MGRRLHFLMLRARVDPEAGSVVDAVADNGPAVVAAGLDQVELVSALRAVLVLPQVAGPRVDGHPLGVAVAVGPYLRLRALHVHERVVGGDAAVVMNPDCGSVVIREVLCGVRRQVAHGRPLPISQRHEEVPVVIEREPPSPHRTAIGSVPRRIRVKQLLDLRQPVAGESAARDRDVPQRIGPGPGVAEVEKTVRGEVRMKDDIAQAGLLESVHGSRPAPKGAYLGQSVHGIGQQLSVSDDAESARTLRYQQIALRREGHGKGADQAIGDFLDTEVVEGGLHDGLVGGGRRFRGRSAGGQHPRQSVDKSAQAPRAARRGAGRSSSTGCREDDGPGRANPPVGIVSHGMYDWWR